MMSKIMVWNVGNIGTSYKRFRKIIKKYDVKCWLLHKLEEAITRFAAILKFTNLCTSKASGGKLWVMWKLQDGFDMVHMTK